MKKVYTGIDIGENSIKIAVMEKTLDTYNLLAKSEVKTKGFEKGKIIDIKAVANCLTEALDNISKELNIPISKVILSVIPKDVTYDIVDSKVKTIDPNMVCGEDVTNLIKEAAKKNNKEGYELVNSFPIGYKLDDNKLHMDPKGLKSNYLYSKVLLTFINRKDLYEYLNILNICNLEVVDIVLNPVADYYAIKNKKIDKEVGVIIDIGESETTISVFNKGIMIKSSIISGGSRNVDHDISYIYKLGTKEARILKESYALASTRYADKYDVLEIKDEAGQLEKISQYKLTEIVEARVEELLNLAKKEIKTLTNRKISYIIILGGLSEMTGFNYIASSILGEKASVWSSTTIGMRHNKYATLIGTIKYFVDKLDMRSKSYNMLDADLINEISKIDENKMKEQIDLMLN